MNRNENFESYKVVGALGEYEDEKTVDTLMDALDDDDESIKEMAISTLGKLGNRKTVNLLSPILEMARILKNW